MKIIALLFCTFAAAFAQVKTAKPQSAAPAAAKSPVDKAALETYLRHLELWPEQVNVKLDDPTPSKQLPGFLDVTAHLTFNGGATDYHCFLSADGKRVVRGDVADFSPNPFKFTIEKLKVDGQPTLGPANAPVNLIVFSDFQCPVCKEEAMILRQNLEKTFPKEVRLTFVDYPLESLHPWAKTAAIAGRCVYKQDPAAFWTYFDWVYENQQQISLENINAKFQEFATEKKLDGMSLGRCVEGKTSEPEVAREQAMGHSLGLLATPTMFMNGRKLEGGLPWNSIEQLVKIELDHAEKSAGASKAAEDACCTLQLPKAGKQ